MSLQVPENFHESLRIFFSWQDGGPVFADSLPLGVHLQQRWSVPGSCTEQHNTVIFLAFSIILRLMEITLAL